MNKEELKPIDVSKYTVTENGNVIKDKLKQEAEEWLNKWEFCNKCENKVDCISNFSYCKKVVLQAYLVSAEAREKRIEHLEKSLLDVTEKSVKRIAELEQENAELKSEKGCETCNKFSDVQLTKAKELLQSILDFENGTVTEFPSFDLTKWIIKAEQFLKDSEVEK